MNSICFALSAVDNRTERIYLFLSLFHCLSSLSHNTRCYRHIRVLKCVRFHCLFALAELLRPLCIVRLRSLSSISACVYAMCISLRNRFIVVIVRYHNSVCFTVAQADAAHLSTSFIHLERRLVTVL